MSQKTFKPKTILRYWKFGETNGENWREARQTYCVKIGKNAAALAARDTKDATWHWGGWIRRSFSRHSLFCATQYLHNAMTHNIDRMKAPTKTAITRYAFVMLLWPCDADCCDVRRSADHVTLDGWNTWRMWWRMNVVHRIPCSAVRMDGRLKAHRSDGPLEPMVITVKSCKMNSTKHKKYK